jgi:two-component sensor histidine kinase
VCGGVQYWEKAVHTLCLIERTNKQKDGSFGKTIVQAGLSNATHRGVSSVNTAMVSDVVHEPLDLFVTKAMLQSRQRTPDLLTEAAEFRELSRIVADDPLLALRRLVEVTRRLCQAGSASVSSLRHDAAGRGTIRWEVISGALASHEGTGVPQDSSPCGLCLRAGTTILVSRPERAFIDLRDTRPSILEDLVVPLYDNAGQPLGTLWVAHHDHGSHFCSDDARIVEQLSVQAVLALKLLEHARDRQHAVVLMESYQRAQHDLLAQDLYWERSLREHAEESESEIRRALALKETAIQEAHHRVKNTLQIAASVLSSHARATASEQVRLALHESHGRLQLLAKAHELLYASVSSTQSILMPPLLETLSDALRQSFTEMSARVKLQITAEPLRLPVDEAIAVALLANEVVTNAYKHAFPNDSRGEITVTLCLTSGNTLMLRITDDGIGLRTRSPGGGIGLKLVRNFAEQLGGVLTVAATADAPGTVITLAMGLSSKISRRHTDSSLDAGQPTPPSEPS